jgi:thiol:disulfide interchange protein
MKKLFLKKFLIAAFCAVAFSTASARAAGTALNTYGNGTPGPVKADHLTVELIVPPPGWDNRLEINAGLEFKMEKGWHVYWSNSGDAGQPPSITWKKLPNGVTAGAMQFPIPKRLALGPLEDFGYEDKVVFPIRLTIAPHVAPDNRDIVTAVASWLVCREVCIPGKALLGSYLTTFPLKDLVPSEVELADAEKYLTKPIASDMQVSVSSSPKEFLVTLYAGHRINHAEFFPYDSDLIANAAPQPVDPLSDGIRIHVQKDPTLKSAPATLHGIIKLSDTEGYEFTVPVTAGAAPVESAALPAILTAATLAFFGGIILNLMPCVFPVLFLKALSLMQSSTHERPRLWRHGLVYTLGILVSFWGIVALLLVLRAGGNQLGWGFQLQSPRFVAVIACLLFFMALSLAGQFDLGLTLTGTGDALTRRTGYSGSFFTGVLATVVATPCTAPLMGAATGFALAQPPAIAFVVFTALALGLAAPYLLLTIQPAWTRLLPKPGAWMELLKHFVSVLLFVSVIWLVWVYGQLFSGAESINSVALLLLALLTLAAAGWVLGRWPAHRRGGWIALVIILAAVAIPLWPQRASTNLQWEPYSAARLSELRAQGKPVFVDFTAAWCLSCQVNERVVLDSDGAQQRLRTKNVALLRADWTKYDPQITAALSDLGRSGVPTYAVYPPGAPPVVLPEALTPGIVDAALDVLPAK